MDSNYERTFVVKVPVERAWKAFVDPRQREAWISPPGRDQLEHPGRGFLADDSFSIPVKIGDVDENKHLSWHVEHTLPSGTRAWVEVSVTFEAVALGTRISITRSGFGEGEEWEIESQNTGLGFEQELIDLVAYLETGVNVSRHFSARSSFGASFLETPAGVQAARVALGGFAEEAGLRTSDLLISLGGAGVYSRSDVGFFEREHAAGEEVEVTYVRDGVLQRGRGYLSEPFYTANGVAKLASASEEVPA
jgi:uncharacterized protein YndB with AHSA1/START domain